MSFNSYLTSHVCYRRLVDEMPIVGSSEQLRLLRLYECGCLPTRHSFALQMRKLEYLTRSFRLFYEQGGDCSYERFCDGCLENGGF